MSPRTLGSGGLPGPGRAGGGGMIFDPMRGGRPEIGGYGPRGPFPPKYVYTV